MKREFVIKLHFSERSQEEGDIDAEVIKTLKAAYIKKFLEEGRKKEGEGKADEKEGHLLIPGEYK